MCAFLDLISPGEALLRKGGEVLPIALVVIVIVVAAAIIARRRKK